MQKDLTLSIINSKASNILITQNSHMKLSSLFDTVVTLGDHDLERTGKYKLLAFVELLGNYYILKKINKHFNLFISKGQNVFQYVKHFGPYKIIVFTHLSSKNLLSQIKKRKINKEVFHNSPFRCFVSLTISIKLR